MRDSRVYLDDILDAINKIEKYTKELSFEAFVKDQKTIDAVVRNFEIIGEATKHVTEKVRKEHPEVPWSYMAGMRDKLIHGYFGVKLDVIWKTIKERLPEVKHLIIKAIDKTED